MPRLDHNQPYLRFFFKYAWVMAFLLICFGFYLHGINKKKKAFDQLAFRYQKLKNELACVIDEQKELKRQIQSQNSPEWIEMILKKKLGLVSEGQIKVFFDSKE
ncbi:MAG: hypothetical protein L0207_03220 [Chlamydiae bacterium]|nr:hypothetical protein [Chlamydiota bacterium]